MIPENNHLAAEDVEKIHLVKVNLMKFCVTASEGYLEEAKEAAKLSVKMERDVSYDFEQGQARYRLYFQYKALGSDEDAVGLDAEVGLEYFFKIDDFEKFVRREDGKKKVDLVLASSLMAISYATSRGIVWEKLRATPFEGVLLPVIDSVKLLLDKEA